MVRASADFYVATNDLLCGFRVRLWRVHLALTLNVDVADPVADIWRSVVSVDYFHLEICAFAVIAFALHNRGWLSRKARIPEGHASVTCGTEGHVGDPPMRVKSTKV